MSLPEILANVRHYNANRLSDSGYGDCAMPDRLDSHGGVFLTRVVTDVIESIEYLDEPTADDIRDLLDDTCHEIADGSVPVYTHALWMTFVDLGAYHEDTTDLGDEGGDLTRSASLALYMIAERVARVLVEEIADTLAEEEDDESLWCEDCGARLDVKGLCPSCLPNSERNPDEVA